MRAKIVTVNVEDAEDGANVFPFLNKNLQRASGFRFEMQLGTIFYNLSLAAPRIPCDIGSHKGNAQKCTLVDNFGNKPALH